MADHDVQLNAVVTEPSEATRACLEAIKPDPWGITTHGQLTVALLNRIAALELERDDVMKRLTPSPLIGLREAVDQYVANHRAADEEVGRLREALKWSLNHADDGVQIAFDMDRRGVSLLPEQALTRLAYKVHGEII